jgi:hypothetical protein
MHGPKRHFLGATAVHFDHADLSHPDLQCSHFYQNTHKKRSDSYGASEQNELRKKQLVFFTTNTISVINYSSLSAGLQR